MQQEVAGSVNLTAARRLVRVNVAAAIAFILGGSLFALGAAFAQLDIGSRATVNITYLVGGCFFSLGGYAVDPPRQQLERPARLAECGRPVRRDAAVRGQPDRGIRRRTDPAAVRRMDLAARHPRVRVLPRVGTPRAARRG